MAETIGAGRIVIGAVEQDAPGYPDCRAAFYEAANRLIDLGTRPDTQIRVAAPLVDLKKSDVVRMGAELGAEVYIFWGGREGADVDIGKDPIEALKRFRDCVNFLCEHVVAQGYRMVFSIEPKPNEPRSDTYLATAAVSIRSVESPRRTATAPRPEGLRVPPPRSPLPDPR